jgi:hypothetical protein
VVRLWDYPAARVLDQRAIAWFPDGGWRLLESVPASFTEAVAIRSGTVVGTDGTGRPIRWEAGAGAATGLAAAGRPTAVNARGSVTFDTGDGLELLQDGVSRPLPVLDPASSGAIAGLTDTDTVYGTLFTAGGDRPIQWDCRTWGRGGTERGWFGQPGL